MLFILYLTNININLDTVVMYYYMTNIKKNGLSDINVIDAHKRGRKPRGGKIIVTETNKADKYNQVTNIILHLKCTLLDLETYNNDFIKNPLKYDPEIPETFTSYDTNNYSIYEGNNDLQNINDIKDIKSEIFHKVENNNDKTTESDEINKKLKLLKINLYKDVCDKKSSCFWCTYDFDNEPFYIPKCEMDNDIYGYGSFCRPECAVAFLMKENIDDSTKFERYHILNKTYSCIYDHKKNIKPAPNPYYLLDKFYGTLTINEYRDLPKLSKSFSIIEKPMTRLLPELHEDNENYIENIFTKKFDTDDKQVGMYKVKRQVAKKNENSKTNILVKEHFGLS